MRGSSVLVVGAGPAGMSAALWLQKLQVPVTVLEASEQLGGMMRYNPQRNDWVLGLPGMSGVQLAHTMSEHFLSLGVQLLTRTRVEHVACLGDGGFCVKTSDGELLECSHLVWATGTSFREVAEVSGDRCRIRVGAGTDELVNFPNGGRVAILGGGDNAFENALELARAGDEVVVFCRSAPRARASFREAVVAHPSITVVQGPIPLMSGGHDGVKVDGWGEFDWLFVLAGYAPGIPPGVFADNCVPDCDETGAVLVDALQRSSIPGLYAIGDVVAQRYPCVPAALAQGAVAAKEICASLA